MTALLTALALLVATLGPIDVPVPPGSDAKVLALFSPYQLATAIDAGPFVLDDLHIKPYTVEATVTDADERLLATVLLDLRTREVTVHPEPTAPPAARQAAERVAATARAHLAQAELRFRPPRTETRRPRPPTAETDPTTRLRPPPALLLALLAAAAALAFARRRIGLPAAPGRAWAAVLGLTLATAVALALLGDVVGHPNAHGWDTVRALVAPEGSPYRAFQPYGLFDVALAAVLGAPAAPGHETFLASRVAATLAVPLMFLFALTATARPRLALTATALFALHPAIAYVGRAETVTAPGVALTLLTATITALAARRRDPRSLLAAALALGVLANFRLMGLILAMPLALLLLLPPADTGPAGATVPTGRAWALRVLAVWAVGAALSVLHGLAIVGHFAEGSEPRPLHPELNLFASPLWTAPVLLAAAALGLLWLARHQGRLASVAAFWLVAAIVAPSASTGCWQDQARYHAYALPAFVLLAGAAVELPWARLGRAASAAVAALALGLLVYGSILPWRAQAHGSIDTAQLALWREAIAALPPGAALVLPVELGNKNRASLPDTELLGARPDVRLLTMRDLAQAPERPTFWFHSVACHREALDPDASRDTDCFVAERTWKLSPVLVRELHNDLPADLAEGARGFRWSFYRLPPEPLTVGLYRVDGRR